MSDDKLEKILATYKPVEGKPGHVWVSTVNNTIVKLDILNDVYIEEFQKGEAHEIDDKKDKQYEK